MKEKTTRMIMCLVTVWAWAGVSQADDTLTLRFAHQNPDTAISSTQCVVPWFEQVEKATKGKV